MKKVSVITLTFVMLINSGAVFSAPKKRRAGSVGIVNTSQSSSNGVTLEISSETLVRTALKKEYDSFVKESQEDLKKILSDLQTDIEKAESSCVGIKDDLKTIQVLAGVSTGASSLGTLTSGGALATGIIKNVKDKKIEEKEQQNNDIKRLLDMSDAEFEQAILNGEVLRVLSEVSGSITREDVEGKQTALQKEIEKDTKTSQILGNVRTGLMAGSIATSATSTITSGISIKKLDDLMDKMKECDKAVFLIKNDVQSVEFNIEDVEEYKEKYVMDDIGMDTTYIDRLDRNVNLNKAKSITQSCTGFDTNNIKDIKGIMTASTVVGGVGTAVSAAGTITSALANSQKIRNDNSDDGVKKEKNLNLASNIMAGISTGTSAGGIVLGAVTLSKLSKNVDVAEKCEDAFK